CERALPTGSRSWASGNERDRSGIGKIDNEQYDPNIQNRTCPALSRKIELSAETRLATALGRPQRCSSVWRGRLGQVFHHRRKCYGFVRFWGESLPETKQYYGSKKDIFYEFSPRPE